MIEFFSNVQLDKQSFWLGFAAGVIFLWFISRLRRYLPRAIEISRQKLHDAREGLTSNAELRYRNETLQHLQKMHLTATMFSLDEIVIPPRIVAPPAAADLQNESHHEDIVTLTIPYLPDWPEMAARYKAPTISLADALSKGANLTLIGQPGSGRTVALAYLATSLIRREIPQHEISNLLPFYVNANEIALSDKGQSPVDRLLKTISRYFSVLTQQRLPSLLQSTFEKNRAILLIDGMDEVSTEHYRTVLDFLKDTLEMYPGIRIVVASSPGNIKGLSQIGMIPVALSSWDEEMIDAFQKSFSRHWLKIVNTNAHPEAEHFYNLLILSWLESHNHPQSPLELTLRIWSAYAGDILGPSLDENIETYIRRTTYDYPEAREVLGKIAALILLSHKLTIEQGDLQSLQDQQTRSNEMLPIDAGESPEIEQLEIEPEGSKEHPIRGLKIESMLQLFSRSGLLVTSDNQVYRFSHPFIAGYLAGSSLDSVQEIAPILEQDEWAGKTLAITYYLHFKQNDESIADLYSRQDKEDLLHARILSAGRWLKNGKSDSGWRQKLMRSLAHRMQDESLTLASSSRFLSALAITDDAHIGSLFRQLLSSEDANVRQIAALGCGMIKDAKSVSELAKLINDPIPGISRTACLALVAIGDKNALETVATTLLQGSETVRRYAAEALANHIEEGHPALVDGSKMDDLLVRRAVVFGLARIHEEWAEKILEDLQLEDQQWIVRNAATQALEDRKHMQSYLPTSAEHLTEAPWLIEFASKLGIGVAPGKPAIDLLIRALRDGDEEVRLSALNYLRINGIEEVIPTILEVYHASLGEVRETAFNTLWHLSAAGFEINLQ